MLVPLPERLESAGGTFAAAQTPVTLAGEAAPGPSTERLCAALGLAREFRTDAPPGAIVLTIDPDQTSLGPEGYRLSIRPDRIAAVASAAPGLFYAVQTIAQLASRPGKSAASGAVELPCVEITDRPRFRWRGLHLDVSRHYFPPECILEALDWAAAHKLNRFHWHLTDDQGWRFPVPGRPRLAEISAWRRTGDGDRYGGMYTQREIRDVVHAAAERCITVVPEIEMPGHARAALAAYPELSCMRRPNPVPSTWGIFEEVFCAGNDATFAFLEEVLDEVAALFPGPYVHIGGDECPKTHWLACPECRRRMEAEGLGNGEDLQGWFVRRIARYLVSRGRRPVGWDEILEGGLAPEAIVMSWRGAEGGIAAVRAGHEAVMCPVGHCYLDSYQGPRESEPPAFPRDVLLEDAYAFEPVPPGITREEAGRILGGQANVWTEYMPDWERVRRMVFPRLCALAEALWTPPERRGFEGFQARLAAHRARTEGRAQD